MLKCPGLKQLTRTPAPRGNDALAGFRPGCVRVGFPVEAVYGGALVDGYGRYVCNTIDI